jgi:E3 ubiquitin-protein ligase SHPRH
VETLSPRSQKYALDLDILSNYFPGGSYQEQVPWRLNDFYDAVHMPSKDTPVSPRLEANVLETKLYPFQIRAVDWLLRREGVTYPLSGGPLSPIDESSATLPVSFQPEKDATGNDIYVSHLRGSVLSELNKMNVPPLRGGILAEEMGLGKTVELLALMRHHRRRLPDGDVFDAYTGAMVKPSGATLIITPPSILEQWINEIGTHAPDLKVKHYKGIPAASAPQREHDEATWEHLMQFDVVLTTYAVLAREIHFATPPPNRSLRFEKQHEARKSPLVQISWWRVCLDEAQMVESGVSNAATVARLIPRCNAWAISGTPLRKDVSDLRGLLVFLRYEPFSTSKIAWGRLDKSTFRTLFHQITLRHTKDKIRDELRLPPQKRVVITVPFTAIEEQNYSDLIRQMCEACGLSPEGRPLSGDRDLTDWEVLDRMREWLIRLRQTCLHAHVGRKNRAALGAKNGPIRTVHEVLEVMIDQNDTAKKTEAREYILTFLRSGHIKGNAGDDEKRSESALPYYKEALEEAQKWVRLCRDELAEEQKKVGKPVLDNLEADEESKEGENLGRIPIIRNSLRSFAELEHACKFFIGTVYFQIKSNEKLTAPDSEEFHSLEKLEVQWYDEAKVIRKELLQETQRKAQHQMKRISSSQPFHQLRKISDLPDLGGIEGRKILTMMDDICDLLNAQADQLVIWRQKIVDILLLPLVDEEEKETTGDEYEDSTKVQDELYVYTLALRSLVANRNEAVNGEADLLANYELKAAEDLAKGKRVFNEWRGHAPELVLEVAHICHKLKRTTESGSLKAVVAATRSLITTLQWKLDGGDHRASAELSILENQLLKIQKIANEEAKALLELEKEQELFRAAMNQRLEFYRQLQHISDTVAPWREELDAELDKKAFEDNARKQALVKKRLSTCISQQAYLHNLRAENQKADEVRECIICKCDFEAGILTSCGHAVGSCPTPI